MAGDYALAPARSARANQTAIVGHHAHRVGDIDNPVRDEVLGLGQGRYGDRARMPLGGELGDSGGLGGLEVGPEIDAGSPSTLGHGPGVAQQTAPVEHQGRGGELVELHDYCL
jgi:hypothetical protein